MTNDSSPDRHGAPAPHARQLGRAGLLSGLGCLVFGTALASTGLAVSGGAAAVGAVIGAALAAGVFVLGALAVLVVSWVYPPASLVVALLTYLCQVLAALMVFSVLTRGGMLDDGTVSGPWLGATLAGCAVLWVVVQIRIAATGRVLLYDLPEAGAR